MNFHHLIRKKLRSLAGWRRAAQGALTAAEKQDTGADLRRVLHYAWQRLALSYGTSLSRIDQGTALFFAGMGEHAKPVRLDDVPLLIATFERDRDEFQALLAAGVSDVAIPKDINFPLFSGPFSEMREVRPADRPATLVHIGGNCVFATTRDSVPTQTVVDAFDKLADTFQNVLRTSVGAMTRDVVGAEPRLTLS